MKLQEFFKTQKHTSFTDVDKLDLYQSILCKRTKKTPKRFTFMHTKYFVYSMIFVIMLFGVYGLYFLSNERFQDNGPFSIRNGTNTASADYIAQIIDAQGNFFIEHKGTLTKTNNIGNGDTILLKEGSQLVFEISSGGTQSQIIGPAKLIIQQIHNENYKLNLVYGNFIQIHGNEHKKQTIELAINDITIKQEDRNHPANFRYVQDGENRIFQNNGANIVVIKSNGEDQATTVIKQQVVAIQNNDITTFENIDTFTKAMQENNISQTFTLATSTGEETITSETGKKENIEDNTLSLLSLLDMTSVSENKEEITQNISAVFNNKKILNPKQDEKVNLSLYKAEYIAEMGILEEAFIKGNEPAFANIYATVERRIQTIYQSFGLTFKRSEGDQTTMLKGLQESIKTIRDIISVEYNIPPQYIENLQSIEKSLSVIIAKGRGSAVLAEKEVTKETQKTTNE